VQQNSFWIRLISFLFVDGTIMLRAECRQRSSDLRSRVSLGAGAKRYADSMLHERGVFQQFDRTLMAGVMVPGGTRLT